MTGHIGQVESMNAKNQRSLGLGVDCGGTYTDAVIYDLEAGEVLASAKYPTSHHDLSRCIDGVLDLLPLELLHEARLACLSTTLATNAIVEGRGGNACLILLGYDQAAKVAPYGSRVVYLQGGHNVRGDIGEPLDEEGLRAAALKHDAWADAFAISAYFSVRNPEHEITARAIISKVTGKPIICGHELSMQLDAPRRATTAAINARLIPLITDLISSVKSILDKREIKCPLMVVRGDGTLMEADMALQRPVETILSGPAASVVGALALSGSDEGVVIDIGGTTTDIAWVKDGLPPINSEGAVVGGLSTRVEAIDIRTIGLGGDSWIKMERDGELNLGPKRVLPIAMLDRSEYVLNELEKAQSLASRWSFSDLMTFWSKAGDEVMDSANQPQKEMMRRLDEGPISHIELKASALDSNAVIHILGMEHEGSVNRAALTPTDIFNAAGDSQVGDRDLSLNAVEAAAHIMGMPRDELIDKVKEMATWSIAEEVLSFLLGVAKADKNILGAWMRGSVVRGVKLSLNLEAAILAAGAPAALFLQPVASALSTKCIIPPHMEVANAVGAVAGVVSHREEVTIKRQPFETYRAFASDGRYDFEDLATATDAAIDKASELAAAEAYRAGASHVETDCYLEDFTVADPKGEPAILERKVIVRAFGRPRLQ
jgi:N-methylhydantoinase A/oxoprolinase/acetone carboxylase beta subunit